MVQLTRLGTLGLYAEEVTGAKSRCVFFVPSTLGGATSITLNDAFRGGGVLLLTPPTEAFGAIEAAGSRLLAHVREHAAIAWYSAADGPAENARRLEIDNNGDIRKFISGAYINKALGCIEAVTARLRWIPTAAATKASLAVDGDRVALLCKPGEKPFQCFINDKSFALLRKPTATGFEQLATIRFNATLQSGSWFFSIEPQDSLAALRDFKPSMSYVFEPEDGYGTLASENFPVFDLSRAGSLEGVEALEIALNAYDTGAGGNYIELQSAPHAKLSITSNFMTRRGSQVHLKAGSARMHFTPNPNAGSFVLSPTGVFELQAPATAFDARQGAKVVDVLVGGAGTEYITFAADPDSAGFPNAIEFVDGCPGFAKKVSSGFELEERTTTSWVRPSWGLGRSEHREFLYVTQSEEAPLFEVPPAPVAARLFADPAGLTFAPKPRLIDAGAGLMPWLPMRNTERSSAMQFDRTVTGVARRRLAGKAQRAYRALARQASDWTVTPQGFFVQVDDEGHWQTIRIAKGDEVFVEFDRPPGAARWRMEEALSRPASFLVATRSPQLAPHESPELGGFRIGAHGWKLSCDFDSAPKAATDEPRPVLIAKFGPGTVLELLEKTEKWSLAAEFNASPAQAQAEASRAVKGLEALSKGDSPLGEDANLPKEVRDAYGLMYAKLKNPEWNGVMIFNAGSSVSQLPDAVAALASGESRTFEKLHVPVMGVDISRVDEKLTQKPSVFGAIHFFDVHAVAKPEGNNYYALKLRNLDAHIDNSKLSSFVAKAELWTGTLMGDPLEGALGGNPVLGIEGRYDGKAAEGDEPRYVIQAVGIQKLAFSSNLLESMEVTRLEFVSKRPKPEVVTARISLRGSLALGSRVVDFCGVKAVKFDELALAITQKNRETSFYFDAGGVSVDWDSGAETAVSGWLKSFPLRLSGLRWSGMSGQPGVNALKWPDLGFSKLDLSLPPALPSMKAVDFDFSLEFDLNLGGFGGMTDPAKLLRGKVLLGWTDFRRGSLELGERLGLGFRFEGGSNPLDVGIQGIFRLRAKRVILKTYSENKFIGFGLDEPQLDILGYEIPKEATVQLAIVVEAKKLASQPSWLFVSRKFAASPLFIDYFAVGQNILLLDPDPTTAPPTDTSNAVKKSNDWVRRSFEEEDLSRLRPRNPRGNKWGLAAKGILKNVVSFDLAFIDEISLYGLRVEIPEGQPFFTADVLYRKISDDLGTFSVEIDPKLPPIEFGVGSLTLPVLGFDRLTNGGGGINLGFNGNDFSKAGMFQAIPFIGSLGVKMGQYTGLSSAFLLAGASDNLVECYKQLDLSPVHEVQLAFRLGFGKEIRQSIFHAGVSLTVYGLLQGALAKVNNPPPAKPIREYVKIAGTVGVLLEIFGAVDFALISAAVSIRAWVEVGIVVETWQPIELYGEADVSVYVKFVIARFKVFGRTFEIAVHYSFSTRVRFGHKLDQRLGDPPLIYRTDMLLYAEAHPQILAEPIDWREVELEDEKTWALPLVLSMDLAVNDDGAPSVVPLMAVHNPAPHGRTLQATGDSIMHLVTGLLRWAVRLHGNSPSTDPADIRYEDLKLLQGRLRSSRGVPASRWMAHNVTGEGTRPLDVSAIKPFLAKNYRFVLMDSKAAKAQVARLFSPGATGDEDLQAIVFPWLREIEIHAVPQDGSGSRPLRVFHDVEYEVVTPEWEEKLKELLKKGRPEYPKDNAQLLMDDTGVAAVASGKSALDLMLEDWVGAALEAVVGDALTLLAGEEGKPVRFTDLLARLVSNQERVPLALQAAQRASSVLLHGLRVPHATRPGWTSIAGFAQMDIEFSNAAGPQALRDGENLAMSVGVKNAWLSGTASLHIERNDAAQRADALVRSIANQTLTLDVALDEFQANDGDGGKLAAVMGPASKPLLLNAPPGTVVQLLPMPWRLQEEVTGKYGPLTIKFGRFVPFSSPDSREPLPGAPPSGAISFAGLFNLRVRKVKAATTSSPGLVEISGAGEHARQILRSWDDDAAIAPNSFRFVVPGAQSGPPSLITQGVKFFTTNLSTEANPDEVAMRLADGTSPVLAEIGDAANMRKFLWMASVVNDAGFYAAIGGNAWTVLEKQLFEKSDVADASVAWLRTPFDSAGEGVVAPGETLVIVEAPSLPADMAVRVVVPSIVDHVSSAPTGFVSLVISRPYTENDPANPDDTVEMLSRYVFLEHSVTVKGKPSLAFDESPVMPPQPPEGLDVAAPFAVQSATELRYYVSVPLGKFLPATAGLSDPVTNPYMFVGQDLSSIIGFGLRDAFGHRFTGKVVPTWKSSIVLFRTPLPQIGTLPALSLTWKPVAAGTLRLELSFAPSPQFRAGDGLIGPYRDLKFNLDTKHVELKLEVALGDGTKGSLGVVIEPAAQVQDMVHRMVEAILKDKDPIACRRSIDFKVPAADINAAVKALPRELSVRLRLKRVRYVDPAAVLVNQAVGQTVTVVRPAIPVETREAWRGFAEEMEAAYPDVFMTKMSRGSNGSLVWLGNAKLLDAPFSGPYDYDLQSYAPRPLSNQFRSGEAVMLNEYGEKAPDAPRKEASDVDLDLLMEQSFELFEALLVPHVAVKLAAHASEAFVTLMESKRSIVRSFMRRLHPIEERKLGGTTALEQVGRRFHSLAAKDLRSIYRLGAIATVCRPNAQPALSLPQIFGTVSAAGREQAVEWSKIRLPLQAESLGVVSASWKPDGRAASVPFPSSVAPSHVEWPWPDSEKEEYAPSRWLELLSVRSLRERRLKVTAAEVPLPLRQLPPTPKIYAHQGTAAAGVLNSVSDARRWTYRLDIAVPAEQQDTLEIDLNYTPRAAFAVRSDTRSLFDSLVGITHHRKVLVGYLSELKSDATSPERIGKLGEYFKGFFDDLAHTLEGHETVLPIHAALKADQDKLTVNIDAPQDSDTVLTHAFSAVGQRKASVELALLDALPQAGNSRFLPVAKPIIGEDTTTYRSTEEVLRAARGIARLSGRRATVTGLDILKQPVIMPAVKAFRNRRLGNVSVDKAFTLATQEIKTSTELVAHLVQPAGRFQISKARKTLAEHLRAFATELFGADAAQMSVDAHSALVVPFDRGGKQVFRSPLGALKGCKPVGGSLADSFARWGGELAVAVGAGAVDSETPPLGLELSVTVYANYADDLPVLELPRLWIDWRHIEQNTLVYDVIPERVFNDRSLLESLYWLTGGWRPSSPKEEKEIRKLRQKAARLLQSTSCYNHLPNHSNLQLRERDAPGMYAAWRECVDVLKMVSRVESQADRALGWFVAPLDPITGQPEREAVSKLLNGPFLPQVDWELKMSSPVNSVWRAVDDPFSGRCVVLVEVIEKQGGTATGPTFPTQA